MPVVKHRSTKYRQLRDLVEELSVVKVEENTELVAERLLKLTFCRYVHLERHRGQAPVAVCRHQFVQVSSNVVVQWESVQRPRRLVELNPRVRRDREFVFECLKEQMKIAGVAVLRVIERVVWYHVPQHVADSCLQ